MQLGIALYLLKIDNQQHACPHGTERQLNIVINKYKKKKNRKFLSSERICVYSFVHDFAGKQIASPSYKTVGDCFE